MLIFSNLAGTQCLFSTLYITRYFFLNKLILLYSDKISIRTNKILDNFNSELFK